MIGGGSTYTPELVSGLSRVDVGELVLHDIAATRREVVGGTAARTLERQGYGGRLTVTDDLDRAVDAADFVLIQIRVGGQEARLRDETAPLACGCIGQETTGAGGFAKAMRTVPVVLEIAERVRRWRRPARGSSTSRTPSASSREPSSTPATCDRLCNVAIGFQRTFARLLDAEPPRIVVDQVGLNHLTRVRRVLLDGDDVLPNLSPSTATAWPTTSSFRAAFSTSSAPTRPTHPLLLCARRGPARAARRHATAGGRRADRARAARPVPRPDGGRAPGAADATRRRLLQRGRTGSRRVALHGRRRRSRGGHPQCGNAGRTTDDDVVEVPARVGIGGAVPLPQRPLAPGCSASCSTSRHTSD